MSNIPVFLPSDNNYAPFVATAIASICDHTDSFCEFYILDSGIQNENKTKICKLKDKFANFSIEFLPIIPEQAFKNFQVPNNLNISTYNRLLIPSLKPDLKKILYIDTDTIILNDIFYLYNTSLEDYALGACWNKDLMNLSENYKYFNAGVLLIDIQKWIKENIVNKLFKIQKEYADKILHADETLLNKYFDNNYKILDIKYNYLDYDSLNSPNHDVCIRHFATPMKPWNSNFVMLGNKIQKMKNFDDFWEYAEMTEFYPELKKKYEFEMNNSPFKKRMNLIVQKTNVN